jgi:non-specific serine/threonine protein kinase
MKSPLFFCLGLALVGCASNETSGAPGDGPASTKPAETVGPRANGTLGEWQALPDLPTPRGNHCAVAANGWLVVIGGNYKPKGSSAFVTTDEVHAARFEADGTLGEWRLAGKTPSPVSSCTAAADGTSIVLVDGIYDDGGAGGGDNAAKTILRTSIAEDGTLAAWTDIGSLPEGVRILYSQASFFGGELRAFHARLPDDGDGIALLRGRDSAFSESTWLDGFRGHPQYVFAGEYIYALGGYAGANKGNEILADGAGAKLDADGTPGASFSVASLPKATAFGKAIAVDDWIFVAGGKDEIMSGKGRAEVFAAKIDTTSGALAEWSDVSALPQGRTSHVLVTHGSYLYVVGGGYDAGGLDSVFSAQVRF